MIPADGLRRASGSAVALGYSLLERTERGADRSRPPPSTSTDLRESVAKNNW